MSQEQPHSNYEKYTGLVEKTIEEIRKENIPGIENLIGFLENSEFLSSPVIHTEIIAREIEAAALKDKETQGQTSTDKTQATKSISETVYKSNLDLPFEYADGQQSDIRSALMAYFEYLINKKYSTNSESQMIIDNDYNNQRLLKLIGELLSPKSICQLYGRDKKTIPTMAQLISRCNRIIEDGRTQPEDHQNVTILDRMGLGREALDEYTVTRLRMTKPLNQTNYPQETQNIKRELADAAAQLADLQEDLGIIITVSKKNIQNRIGCLGGSFVSGIKNSLDDILNLQNGEQSIIDSGIITGTILVENKKTIARALTGFLKEYTELEDTSDHLSVKVADINFTNDFVDGNFLHNLKVFTDYVGNNLVDVDDELTSDIKEYIYLTILLRNLDRIVAKRLPALEDQNESASPELPRSTKAQQKIAGLNIERQVNAKPNDPVDSQEKKPNYLGYVVLAGLAALGVHFSVAKVTENFTGGEKLRGEYDQAVLNKKVEAESKTITIPFQSELDATTQQRVLDNAQITMRNLYSQPNISIAVLNNNLVVSGTVGVSSANLSLFINSLQTALNKESNKISLNALPKGTPEKEQTPTEGYQGTFEDYRKDKESQLYWSIIAGSGLVVTLIGAGSLIYIVKKSKNQKTQQGDE